MLFWQAIGYGVIGTIVLGLIYIVPALTKDFREHHIVYRCRYCGDKFPNEQLLGRHEYYHGEAW